jgi:hypothetical protein
VDRVGVWAGAEVGAKEEAEEEAGDSVVGVVDSVGDIPFMDTLPTTLVGRTMK